MGGLCDLARMRAWFVVFWGVILAMDAPIAICSAFFWLASLVQGIYIVLFGPHIATFGDIDSAQWGSYNMFLSAFLALITLIKYECLKSSEFPLCLYISLVMASSLISAVAYIISCINLGNIDYSMVQLGFAAAFALFLTIAHIPLALLGSLLTSFCGKRGHRTFYFIFCLFAFMLVAVGFGGTVFSAINFNRAKPCRRYSTAAVASSSKACSEVGKNVMKDGGNAADAAVAVSFCLGVVEFQSSGLGGGGFLLHFHEDNQTVTSIDFRSVAPILAHSNTLDNKGLNDYPELYVAVPGELIGLHQLWKTRGKSKWKDLIAPSINLARDGFTVSKDLANAAASFNKSNNAFSPLLNLIRPNGNPIQEGTTLKRPNLAATLEKISLESDSAFFYYENEMINKIIEDLRLEVFLDSSTSRFMSLMKGTHLPDYLVQTEEYLARLFRQVEPFNSYSTMFQKSTTWMKMTETVLLLTIASLKASSLALPTKRFR